MKYYKHLVVPLLLMIGLSSCRLLNINQNEYNLLTVDEKNSIKPFTLDTVSNSQNGIKNTIKIEEITMNDLKKLSKKYQYVWIHSFVPSCSQLDLNGIEKILNIEKKYNKALKVVLLSETFDFQNIKYLSLHYNRSIIVYILHHNYYPSNTRKSDKLFFKQLKKTNKSLILNETFYSDYVLQNGHLQKVRKWDQKLNCFLEEVSIEIENQNMISN